MSRSTKKDYPRKNDSRKFDRTCRCHGTCSYCQRNRLFFDDKARARLNGQVEDFFHTLLMTGITDWSME